jgi:hypothetical protein
MGRPEVDRHIAFNFGFGKLKNAFIDACAILD